MGRRNGRPSGGSTLPWPRSSSSCTSDEFWPFAGKIERVRQRHAQTNMTGGKRLLYVAGLYLALFSWLIYLAWDTGDHLWAWIIAAIMITLFAWRLYQGRGKAGAAAIRDARPGILYWLLPRSSWC